MNDLISRQAAVDALRYAQHRFTVADEAGGMGTVKWSEDVIYFAAAEKVLAELPSAEPTLYGYKIEHLAYIAKVMEKEGVTAEYAVRTFDDMSRVVKMIIDEAQQKVEEALDISFGHLPKTGGESKDSQQ